VDTFDLLPTLAAGELEQTSAAELVAAIFRSRASGTLSIEGEGGVEIRQFFRAGDMCGSAFFAGFRTLAQVLLANDWVAALDIDASRAEAQAAGKQHGQVLVDKHLLTAEQLKQALYTQHKQNLAALLQLQRGHYELRGWEPPPAWSRELSIDPVSVLADALESDRMSARRQRVLEWLGDHAARLSVDWPEISARAQLDAADRRAAALLALPRRPAEFTQLSRLTPARADGLLVALLLTGAAEAQPVAQGGFSAGPRSEAPRSAPPPAQYQQQVPTYVPSTAPPERADSGPHEPISEPVLIPQDGAPGEASELVPLEAEPPPAPKKQTRPPSVRSMPPPPVQAPQSAGPRPRMSPGMPLFSRPATMPPKPNTTNTTNSGYKLPQPTQPPTNPGYRVDQRPISKPVSKPVPPSVEAPPPVSSPPPPPAQTQPPPKPARKVPPSFRSPPSVPRAPEPAPAAQPEYGFDALPAEPAPAREFQQQQYEQPQAPPLDPFAEPAPVFEPPPFPPARPASRRTAPPSSRSLSPAQPQRFEPPRQPPEQDAFARLEALALEHLDAGQEQAALEAVRQASQELPQSSGSAGRDAADPSGGLRRVEGGGFEFNGSPSDRMQMDVHKSRPSAAPGIPPPDDSAMLLRKKMRAQGMRNLAGAPHAPPVPEFDFAEQEPQPSVDETQLAHEDRRFIDDVRSRVRTIAEQDAWARLGVTRNATSDQIRAAYLEAAKRYHPDHAASPAFAGIQEELRSLFQSVKDAYDQIATAPAREAYANALKQGTSGKVRDRKEEAALALKMGEALLKKRDFAAAMVKLRRSVELDPNGDSLAALGWGLMCDPATSPAGKEEAATLLSKALRAHGLSARTYYVAGVLWRTKDPDSAADAFRKALELEPNHADASLELRLLEMRQGKKSSGGGVLSTLLFGKKR
jgi:tetratricopeptide (TPR) repeat protein